MQKLDITLADHIKNNTDRETRDLAFRLSEGVIRRLETSDIYNEDVHSENIMLKLKKDGSVKRAISSIGERENSSRTPLNLESWRPISKNTEK